MTTPAKAIGIIRENLITKLHIYHYVIISSDPTCKLFYRYPSILSFQKVIKSKLYNILHFLRNTMHLYMLQRGPTLEIRVLTRLQTPIFLSDDNMGFINHPSIKYNYTWGQGTLSTDDLFSKLQNIKETGGCSKPIISLDGR